MSTLSPGDQHCCRRHTLIRRLAAFLAMLAVAMAFRGEHLTDWDSWDYAAQAIMGHSSDLLLGRWWFVATMRAAYLAGQQILGLTPLDGYLAMQVASSVMMAGAVVVLMAWTRRLTGSIAAEVLVAVLLVPGPMIGIYASAVMTESMAVLMIGLAFWAWESAVCAAGIASAPGGAGSNAGVLPARNAGILPALMAMAGGLAFGILIDIREPAVLLAAWPVISCIIDKPPRRWLLLGLAMLAAAVTLLIGIYGAWAWHPWGYFENMGRWTAAMTRERELFPVSLLENAKLLFAFSVSAAPVATVLLAPSLAWAAFRRRRLFWLALATAPYVISMLINHDLPVNPRFPIPMVFVLTPIVAAAIDAAIVGIRRRYRLRLAIAVGSVAMGGAVAIAIGWDSMNRYYFDYVDSQQRTYHAMRALPENSAVIAGPGTPVANYLNRLGHKHFYIIGSGWGWPGEGLAKDVAGCIADGRPVYANLDYVWHRSLRKSSEWDELEQVARGYRLDYQHWPMVELVPHPAPGATQPATQQQVP